MKSNSYIKGVDIWYDSIIRSIKKSKRHCCPIFEAVTNSLESINLRSDDGDKGHIIIKLFFNETLIPDTSSFDHIVIEDNGVGFDDVNFERLKRYKDDRKSPKSKGSGRIQFLHFFNESKFISVYNDNSGLKKRSFILSKSDRFLKENAIIYYEDTIEIKDLDPVTILTLKELLDKHDQQFYDHLTIDKLKDELIFHYIEYFCSHRQHMPEIKIQHYIDQKFQEENLIIPEDIPNIDQQKDIKVNYSKLSSDGKSIEQTSKSETFHLNAFKINQNKLCKNEIKITSKNEIRDEIKIKLESLSPTDIINDNRYLFLISGDYIENKEEETRGLLNIPNKDQFKKANEEYHDLFDDDEILLDDIQVKTNETVISMYEEIKKNTEKKKLEIEKLKSMFLLNEQTIDSLQFNLMDSEEKILEKIYSADVKITAGKDAEIKKIIDSLDGLDPSSPVYKMEFDKIITELVQIIPVQNRTTLTQYVARRKLILDLFDKILTQQLQIQQNGQRNIDEKLLHNLIFQQSSNNPDKSDLWVVNEDFIYFKGTSESMLCDIKIDGQKIIKEKLSPEEERYRLSLDEDRLKKRPDILLFPDEGKCIIIELKNPEVNISVYLTQINRYASLIRNLSKDEIQFSTFYGYLLGEKIDSDDVRDYDADFKHAYNFDYVFRPSKAIAGKFGRSDGELYTEVIKYSTLLKRAKRRNEIFIKKLTEHYL